MRFLAFFAAVLASLVADALPLERIEKVFEETPRSLPLSERLALLTQPFLNVPYVLSPLGEGEGIDTDPRLRFDAFDCLTFIETAIALAAADRFSDLESKLDEVRYASTPSFVNRNHFVEAQWLPTNTLKGYVREISTQLVPDAVVQASKEFSVERWDARKKSDALPLSPDEVPRGTFSFPMLPLEAARARLSKIPSGTLLFVVRKDLYTQPTRITHVGIVLDKGGRKMLRHAAGKPYMRVIDEPLENFLTRNSRYTRWPVEGIALYRIELPSASDGDVVAGQRID